MKQSFRLFVFSFAIILSFAGISKAEAAKSEIGGTDADESRSPFFRSFQVKIPGQDALQLSVGKFQKTDLFKWNLFTPPSLNMIPQTALAEQAPLPDEKKSFVSLYLGGGLNNIDGGDLNRDIRDNNARYEALNGLGYQWINAMYWKEIKWMPHLKGEIILNLFKRFGLGLGFEHTTKINPRIGTLSQYRYGSRIAGMQESFAGTASIQGEHELTVQPVTLNFYYFIPVGRVAEVFLTGGVGYYMGNLKFNGLFRNNSLLI